VSSNLVLPLLQLVFVINGTNLTTNIPLIGLRLEHHFKQVGGANTLLAEQCFGRIVVVRMGGVNGLSVDSGVAG